MFSGSSCTKMYSLTLLYLVRIASTCFLGKGYNYFDIFGWTNSITNILSNFTEFKNEDELFVQKCTKEFVINNLHRYNYKQFEVEKDWPEIEKIYRSEIIIEPYKGRILEYKFINELLK